MDRYYNCSGTCSDLEVDYDKKEIRARTRDCWGEYIFRRGFDVITHYEFEYVKTEWAESDLEDSDSRDHLILLRETMHVNGPSEELGDFNPEEERHAILLQYEVGLKLWYFYFQNSELKHSSLYFSQKDAFEARRKLKPLIKYLGSQGLEDKNMFVGSEHLRIGDIVSLGIPASEFSEAVSSWRQRENVTSPNIFLPKFGECTLDIGSQENVGWVVLETVRKMSEEEVLPLFDYMRESMPIGARYDDGGYGVPAPPHKINHFWPLPLGEVYMRWHGLRDFCWYNGLDYVRLELWEQSWLNEIRDEAYWRSEVD